MTLTRIAMDSFDRTQNNCSRVGLNFECRMGLELSQQIRWKVQSAIVSTFDNRHDQYISSSFGQFNPF